MKNLIENLVARIIKWFKTGRRWILAIPLVFIIAAYYVLTQFFTPHELITRPYRLTNPYLLGFLILFGVLSIGSIIAYIIAINRRPPDDRFIILVAEFKAITSEADNEVKNVRHDIVETLKQEMVKHQIKGVVKTLNQTIDADSDETRKKLAKTIGKHTTSHLVVYGEVRNEKQEYFFRPIVLSLVEQAFRFAPDPEPDSSIKIIEPAESPRRLEFREQKATETIGLTLFICGMIRFNDKKYNEAISILKAIPIPTYQSHFYCGCSYFHLSEFEKALHYFDQATVLKPDFGQAWFFKVFAANKLGKDDVLHDVMERFDSADRKFDERVDSDWFGSLDMYTQSHQLLSENIKKYHEGLVSFMDAIRSSPLLEEAPRIHEELEVMIPQSTAHHHYVNGLLLLSDHNYEAAIGEFEQALEQVPNYPKALIEKGFALAKLGECDRAREVLEIAEKHPPDNAPYLLKMAKIYVILGDHDKAIQYLKDAFRYDPVLGKRATEQAEEFDSLKGSKEFDSLIQSFS